MRSHRAAVATAIATTAAFTAAGPAVARPASAQNTTTLSITAPARDPGLQPVYIRSVLRQGRSALPRRSVVLEFAPATPMGY